MIKLKRSVMESLKESKLRDADEEDLYEFSESDPYLPSGDSAKIATGEYATVLVACDDSCSDGDVSVSLSTEDGYYYAKTCSEDEAIKIANKLVKYIDEDCDFDEIADKYDLEAF